MRRIPKLNPQAFKNGEIHDWYRIILGFSDHLVADLIKEFELQAGDRVLDPFSGAATTAVECKKRGIDCWAIDANPSSCFAAKVKTTWTAKEGDLIAFAATVADSYDEIRRDKAFLKSDPTYHYLHKTGMLKRSWITPRRLYDVIAVKKAIQVSPAPTTVRRALTLGLMHCFVHRASNVRFGPELYCGSQRKGVSVINEFLVRAALMEDDLKVARAVSHGKARISLGDSRQINRKKIKAPKNGFDAIISSPPYPTEHDYTRNSRLELAFLENVTDGKTLRGIKKGMIRSHTKGIYVTDDDEREVSRVKRIQRLVLRIDKLAKTKSYGFARLYGKVTKEYFGGMRRHFRTIYPLLKPGGRCAYVVGDQASYFRVNIATASILGEIAKKEGFAVDEIRIWRKRWASGTKKFMKEHILFLRRPKMRVKLTRLRTHAQKRFSLNR
jgi:DNA modification methylase